jgi:hypothetical protein
MVDIASEKLLTLANAALLRPLRRDGKATHVSTVHRWITTGIRGVKLEAVRIGGTWFTSIQAVQRFADRLTELGSQDRSPPTDTSARQRHLEVLDEELRRLGL